MAPPLCSTTAFAISHGVSQAPQRAFVLAVLINAVAFGAEAGDLEQGGGQYEQCHRVVDVQSLSDIKGLTRGHADQ